MIEWHSRTHIIYHSKGTFSWKSRPCITLQSGVYIHDLGDTPLPTGHGYVKSHPHYECLEGCPFYNRKKPLHRCNTNGNLNCTVQIADDEYVCVVSTDCKKVFTPSEALVLMIKIAMDDFNVVIKYLKDATQIEFHRLIMSQKIEQAVQRYNYMT